MAKNNKKGLVFPKLLMLIGALCLMAYAIATGVTKPSFKGLMYGFSIAWPMLIFISIIFIIIPFSVKAGTWTLLWGIVITAATVIFLVGGLVDKVDFKSYWTYLSIGPYLLLALGSFLWTITAYMK